MAALKWAAAVAAAVLAASAASADTFEMTVKEAATLADANQCDKALPLIRQALASPAIATAPDKQAKQAWEIATHCAFAQRAFDDAYADSLKATAFENAEERAWLIRLMLAMNFDKRDDAVGTAELLAKVEPRLLGGLEIGVVRYFDYQLAEAGAKDLQQRLLAALDQADYKPSGPFDQADALWLDYAGILADDGSVASATRVLDKLQRPFEVLQARLDRRFISEIAAEPERFDARKVTERQLAKDQATMHDHPDLAQGVIATAMDLRMLGRAKEALDLLDAALANIDAAPKGKPAFSDLDAQAIWLFDQRARAVKALGRFDDEINELRKGAALKEFAADNVSQTINLAEALNNVGRPKEALDTLAPFGIDGEGRPASPYGVMEMMGVRACADAQLRQAPELAATLAFMRAHQVDDPSALSEALICAGDLDGAAASYVSRLADPGTRSMALLSFSDLADKPPPPPWEKEMDRRFHSIGKRPDVKAAIAKVGHVETFPLAGDNF